MSERLGKEINKLKPYDRQFIRETWKKKNKKVWVLFSEVVRLRARNENGKVVCYTCGKEFEIKSTQAGHRWHNKLDFDNRNVRAQCEFCNNYGGGKPDLYDQHLDRDIGPEGREQLKSDAFQHKGYTFVELCEIEERLKKEREQLLGYVPKKKQEYYKNKSGKCPSEFEVF